jgi:hypothetical protein
MNDGRPSREIDSPRVRRSSAALVAQYIHELSDRHGGKRSQASQGSVKRIQVEGS